MTAYPWLDLHSLVCVHVQATKIGRSRTGARQAARARAPKELGTLTFRSQKSHPSVEGTASCKSTFLRARGLA